MAEMIKRKSECYPVVVLIRAFKQIVLNTWRYEDHWIAWLSVGIFYCYCKTYNNKSKTTTISFVKYLLRVPRIWLKREMAITLKQPDKMSNTNKGEITARVAFEKREKVHRDVSLPVRETITQLGITTIL